MADDDSELSGRPAGDQFSEQQRRRDGERDSEAVVTRSEEELWIATVRRERQLARLTRYVETETVTKTVEVCHDQVRIEYEPISATNRPDRPGRESAAEDDGWMVLYDEEVIVTTRRVPRERVRLRTHTVTEGHTISETVRKEQIGVNPRRSR
jgi:uncharacterized protein (TIGR02271 family)